MYTAEEETVTCTIDDRVAVVTLNRPHRLNAVSAQLVQDLYVVLQGLVTSDVRAAVLTGAGRAFCAGQDLKEIPETGSDRVARRNLLQRAQGITRSIQEAPFPVIAAVHGYAMGAGCEFALMCDLVVADESAVFAFPEVSVAQAVGQGISHRLTAVVGPARAKELVLLGRRFLAAEAERLGLINEVVASGEAMPRALELAAQIKGQSALAVELAKRSLDAGLDLTLEESLAVEVENLMAVHDSPDMSVSAQQFLKR